MTTSPTPSTFELDDAVASEPGDDGLRHLVMTADWNTPNGTANGGYVLAVLARAVLDHAADAGVPHPDLLSVSVSYFKPPTPGPTSVSVSTLRQGRRVSVHEAALLQAGTAVAHAVVTLHDWDAAGDAEHTPHAAPAMPAPEDCLDLMGRIPAGSVPIVERYDARHASVPGWMEGEPSGVPETLVWIRPKDGRPIDALAAAAIVDGYPPVTTEIGHMASATVQLTVHLRRRPDAEWALLDVRTRHVVHGYHDEDVELWDERGNLIAQSRQIAVLS